MKVLVTGASGFVGSSLCAALIAAGHDVVAMTRRPATYKGAGTAVHGDVEDPTSLAAALDGCDAAYYLVHSLDSEDFEQKDRQAAGAFGAAAADSGVHQVVYLGGLGRESDDLSDHLASRREVEKILRSLVPTTVLRAGVIIGDGGISWEMLRQLVANLPVMVTPKWVRTRTQPVGIDDVVVFLVGVLGSAKASNETYDIGGPDVLTYGQMLEAVGDMPGGRLKLVVPVPVLSPKLSSHWLRLITDVDATTARALVESMSNEVVVRDRRIETLTNHRAVDFETAARRALEARRVRLEAAESIRA